MNQQPVKVLIVGAGGRGSTYAGFAQEHPERMQVVGVAEPRDFYRQRLADSHHIPAEHVFSNWQAAAGVKRFADAVIIATQDAMHAEPAEIFAGAAHHCTPPENEPTITP